MDNTPRVGAVFATQGLPRYPDDKLRYCVIVGAAEPGVAYVTTLTTDKHGHHDANTAIAIGPATHPTVYRTSTNHQGLPPRSGWINTVYLADRSTAIFRATVALSVNCLLLDDGTAVSIDASVRTRFNEQEWQQVRAAAPPAAESFFHDYNTAV